ncbi:hypothetical protein [Metallosphaera sp.]|uniref:nucleotide-binding protein n=2 Tax=Sulfolobaceae TaxID=118883 RepID=UPI0031632EA2
MMKKIIITGVKGGTGKSLISFLLLRELVNTKRVLFIDLDNTLTVTRLLGILHLDDIFNNDYNISSWTYKNVSIIPLGVANQGKLQEFPKAYMDLVEDKDIIMIDSSNITNPVLSFEAKLSPQSELDLILVTTPQSISLKRTIDTLLSFKTIYPIAPLQKLVVLNMAKEEVQELPNNIPFVKIPFIKELFLKGISAESCEYPSILASIRDILYILGLTKILGDNNGNKRVY